MSRSVKRNLDEHSSVTMTFVIKLHIYNVRYDSYVIPIIPYFPKELNTI